MSFQTLVFGIFFAELLLGAVCDLLMAEEVREGREPTQRRSPPTLAGLGLGSSADLESGRREPREAVEGFFGGSV